MLIIPAIDIRAGKCVRLKQGNFAKQTIYGDDPVVMAKRWKNEGAKMLHVVDLDGAKDGKTVNLQIIEKIVKAVKIPLQVGGGIRNEKAIIDLLKAGVLRIVIGTIVFDDEILLRKILDKYLSQVAVALDTKKGILVKKGWKESTSKSLIETAKYLENLGVKRFIYTNTLRDGTLTQPNYQEIEVLLEKIKTPIIVSGGISSITDIKKLKIMRAEGVIIGKALYENRINLRKAINAG